MEQKTTPIEPETEEQIRSLQAQIRRQALEQRNAMLKEERERKNIRLLENLFSCAFYQQATHILCYVSYGSEVDTHVLIETALAQGKRVYCPRVLDREKPGKMEFYEIRALSELEKGYRGILEPKQEPDGCYGGKTVDPSRKTLLLMPGTAFDRNCHRIGYGGGFYDRFLSECKENITTMALAYDRQLVEHIPVQKWDILPRFLLTENGVLNRMEKENSNES